MDITLRKCKVKLARLLKVDFSAIETDKGALQYDGELGTGTDVYILDENGEMQPAPDGEYTASDGTVYTVVDGRMTNISESESNENMEVIEMADPIPENSEVEASDHNALVEIVNDLVVEIAEIKEEIQADFKKKAEAYETQIEEQKKEIAQLKADFAAFKKEPAAGVIESDNNPYNFNSGEFKSTGDAKLDKAISKWRTNH